MDLTAEAIRIIMEAGRDKDAFAIHQVPDDPYRYIVRDQGDYKYCDKAQPVRNHVANDLGSLISFVSDIKQAGKKITIWHNVHEVAAILDDGWGLDRIVLGLQVSEQFHLLKKLAAKREPMSQKDVIRLLRVDFAGCVAKDTVAAIRSLTFKRHADGESDVQHAKETFGKKVMAEVAGLNAIPEEIQLDVPVYVTPGEDDLRPINCVLEVEPADLEFYLIPRPLELTKAMEAARESIFARLRTAFEKGDEIFIYHGSPEAPRPCGPRGR